MKNIKAKKILNEALGYMELGLIDKSFETFMKLYNSGFCTSKPELVVKENGDVSISADIPEDL